MEKLRVLPCLLALTVCAPGSAAGQGSERPLRLHLRTAMIDSALVRVTVRGWRAPIGRVIDLPDGDFFVLDPDGPEGPDWLRVSEVRLLELAIAERVESRSPAKGWLIGALVGGAAATFACRPGFRCGGGSPAVSALAGVVAGGILGWAVAGAGDPRPSRVRFAVVWRGD